MIFLLLLLLIPTISCAREIRIYNKCPFTNWARIIGSGNPEGGGFRLYAGQIRSIYVAEDWSGRIWPMTECDEKMKCATGNCPDEKTCNGTFLNPPATVALITLNGAGNVDFYDISLLDGYNLPVLIDVVGGTGQCHRAGGCFININDVCPEEFTVKKDGRNISCKSSCRVYDSDKECCRGAFASEEKCRESKTSKIFRDSCPMAYSAEFGNTNSSFTCSGAIYIVQFC